MTLQRKRLRVAIVGAGIIGTSIAYQLAERDVAVSVFERGPGPASGVTSKGFGWINMLFVAPSNAGMFALRRAAVNEYARLTQRLPRAFAAASHGSLLWKSDRAETESLAGEIREEGLSVELISRREIERREPLLRSPPRCALASPKDIALHPAALAGAMLAAAVERGTTFFANTEIIGLNDSGSGVTGLTTTSETFVFDLVVLAAGAWSEDLLRPLGLSLGLEVSPALLLRYSSDRALLRHIVKSPELEIRQWPDNSLVIAKSLKEPLPDATAVNAMGMQMLARIRDLLATTERVAFETGVIGHRPMFSDGFPRAGHLANHKGLYVAVGPPGVILAPLLGRVAASEIIDGGLPDELSHLADCMGRAQAPLGDGPHSN